MTSSTINVRIEPVVRDGESQTASAWIEGVSDVPYRLWYRIDSDQFISELALAHAFTVSTIHQAMAMGRDLVIDGPLTRGLIANLDEYQRVWTTWEPRRFHRIALRPHTLIDDEPFRPQRGAVLPFSGGIDSLFTAKTLQSEADLAALVTIHGLDVRLDSASGWNGMFAATSALARSLGVPNIAAATNWQTVAPRQPGYLGYFAPTIVIPILLSAQYGYAAIPSAYSYDRLSLPQETSPLTDPLQGRPGFPMRHHGAWMRRIDKARAIAGWPEAMQHMRPCDRPTLDGTSCGLCRKCVCTALLFCGLGLPVPQALGGRVPDAQSVQSILMTQYGLVALGEAVEAAKSRGNSDEWVDAAISRLDEFGWDPSNVPRLNVLQRKLDYVLGAGPRTAIGRYFRRVSRAVRGRCAPRDLEIIPQQPYRLPIETPAKPVVENHEFALSPRGRRIYIASEDERGQTLAEKGGDLHPTTSLMWRELVASKRWTHIVDVGANYGELLIDLEAPAETQIIAVEPNPFVRACLERSLRETGLPCIVVAKAVSDRPGNMEFHIDRTWSGFAGDAGRPHQPASNCIETVRIETVTLPQLLDDGKPKQVRRALIKIDVEGHERAILRGLKGTEGAYGELVILIEAVHFVERDWAAILDDYVVDVFDLRSRTYVTFSGTSTRRLRRLLRDPRFYTQDIVLRPRGTRAIQMLKRLRVYSGDR